MPFLYLICASYNNHYYIDDIVSWNIFFEHFVFKLDDREDGGGWFYIIKFKKG